MKSEWGFYDKTKEPWTKIIGKTAEHRYQDSPNLPVLPITIDMSVDDAKAISDFFNVSLKMGQLIVRLRKKSAFASGTDVANALATWFGDPNHARFDNWEDDMNKVGKQLITKTGQILY